MVFVDEFIADHTQIRSVLDYSIEIRYEDAELWLDDDCWRLIGQGAARQPAELRRAHRKLLRGRLRDDAQT